jgi:hypothetical protein
MSRSTFSGPVLSGTVKYNTYNNIGNSVVSQTDILNQNSTNVVNSTLYIPAQSQILRFTVDVLTAFNSATSATLTIGTASGGTQYVTSVDAKTAGRASITFTAAQLLAMSSAAINTTDSAAAGQPISTIVITITPVGATSAGQVLVTTEYVQFDDRSAGSAV